MLSLSVKLQSVQRDRVILGDIVCSANADHRSLVHIAKKDNRHVGISYVGMKPVGRENIELLDIQEIAGSSLARRNNSYLLRHKKRVERTFDLPVGEASLTDVTTVDLNGTRKPLFYKHVFTGAIGTGESDVNSILIRNRYLEAIPRQGNWEVIVTLTDPTTDPATYTTVLFHSFKPSYDTRTYAHEVYYIEYTDTDGNRRLELLESESAYSQARLEHGVNFFERLYTVQKQNDKYRFTILRLRDDNGLMMNGPWYVLPESRHQIKARKPVVASPFKQWHLSITDSSIFAFDTVGQMYRHYYVPEYHLQSFMPSEPRKFSASSECFVLSEHLIILPFENLLKDENNAVDILITDVDLSPKIGFTTADTGTDARYWTERLDQFNPEHLGISFKLQKAEDRGLSFNRRESLCYIPASLEPDDRVFIRAFYEEKRFEFVGLNLNPIQNLLMVDSKAYIYLIPENGVRSLLEQQSSHDNPEWQLMPVHAVQYIIINRYGQITAWSDFRLSKDINGSYTDRLNLLDEITGAATTEFEAFQTLRPEVLFISSVSIRRNQRVNDLAFIDVREKGGILREEIEEILVEEIDSEPKMPELLWASRNSASNRSIPLQGVSIVKIPCEILADFGGQFTRSEVEEKVQKHYALGSAPVIEYYGEIPKVFSVEAEIELPQGPIADGAVEGWSGPPLRVKFRPPRRKDITTEYFDSDTFTYSDMLSHEYRFYLCNKLPLRDIDEEEQSNWIAIDPANITQRSDPKENSITAEVVLGEVFTGTLYKNLFLKIVPIVNGNEWPSSKPVEIRLLESTSEDLLVPAISESKGLPVSCRLVEPNSININFAARLVEV